VQLVVAFLQSSGQIEQPLLELKTAVFQLCGLIRAPIRLVWYA
jgi:hypothetical protein